RSLQLVQTVRGAADTSIEQEADQPGLRILLDRAQLARYGLNVEDLSRIIESAVGGAAIGSVFEGDRHFDIAVRYAPEWRSDTGKLNEILVRTADGAQVPLGQLAEIKLINRPTLIPRRHNP